MKKVVLITVTLLLTVSCATHRNARLAKTSLRGDWQLNTITYDKQGLFKINLFDNQPKRCLENSLWHFVVNNASGFYQYQNQGCSDSKHNFYFSVEQAENNPENLSILIKPVDAKRKSSDNHGYRLKLVQLSKGQMRWDMKSHLDGETFMVHLNFQKINNK